MFPVPGPAFSKPALENGLLLPHLYPNVQYAPLPFPSHKLYRLESHGLYFGITSLLQLFRKKKELKCTNKFENRIACNFLNCIPKFHVQLFLVLKISL